MAEQKATNVTWHDGEVSRDNRYRLMRQRGATIWFTGLSGSGKSTIAVALETALYDQSKMSYRLDGDNVRLGINKNLGFSEQDRKENIRRIGEIAKLFGDAGTIALSSFISPTKPIVMRFVACTRQPICHLSRCSSTARSLLQRSVIRKVYTKRLELGKSRILLASTIPMKRRRIRNCICRPTG